MSSHKTDRILTESLLLGLSCLLYRITRVTSLMYALVLECLCEISINVNKLFIVYFVYVRPCRIVVACLFVYPLFLYCTLLLLVICLSPYYFYADVVAIFFILYVNHVNRCIIFIFWRFCLSF